jgi:lipopolysaccharide export system protein LptC
VYKRQVSIDLKGRTLVGSGGVTGAVPAGTFSAQRIFANLTERTVTLDGSARLQMQPGKFRMPS